MNRWRHLNPWLRLLGTWALVSALTASACLVTERQRFGRRDEDGVQRVIDAVTADFGATRRTAESAAEAVAREGALINAATGPAGVRAVFALLASVGERHHALSTTVYTVTGSPVAWHGSPSDLPRARTGGTAAVFVAPVASGPRLFVVQPIQASPSAARAGTVVAEMPLPTAPGAPGGAMTWSVGPVGVEVKARYEGAGAATEPGSFALTGPDGAALLEGHVRLDEVRRARQSHRTRLKAALGLVFAAWLALATAPLLARRRVARTRAGVVLATAAMVALVIAARVVAWFGLPLLQPGRAIEVPWGFVARSPLDTLLTAAAALLSTVFVAGALERARAGQRRTRLAVGPAVGSVAPYYTAAILSAALVFSLVGGLRAVIVRLAQSSASDLVAFAVWPAEPARLAGQVALILSAAAATWAAATVLLASRLPFRMSRDSRHGVAGATVWLLLLAAWIALPWLRDPDTRWSIAAFVVVPPVLVAIGIALRWRVLVRFYRHASQGVRLLVLCAALLVPALAWYPTLVVESEAARRETVSTGYAREALLQREDLKARVSQALKDVDAIPGLADLVEALPAAPLAVPSDSAYHVWSQTGLSRARLTSAIELYGANRLLVSRFALKLPDYTSAQQAWDGTGCAWELFEEVSPFFSEERRLLYAGRGLCVDTPDGPKLVGAIAIYAMLDYADLPFIAAQNPYVAMARQRDATPRFARGRRLDFVVYGWSRTPVYASGDAWPLDEQTFARVYASREPIWTTMRASGRTYAVHVTNDRGGIYALGYPVLSPVEHLVHLAELTVLAAVTFLLALLITWLASLTGGGGAISGRELLHEVRASFYRKVVLAFVATATIPVAALAVVAQAYLASRLLAGVEEAALRTASVAQRVVEDYAQLQERGQHRVDTVDDDILVWIARVIDQDVNVFEGAALTATSERSLYASGLLPTRTSADIYRAVVLDRQAAHVTRDRVGQFDYLSAAAPVHLGGRDAIITVPLTLRQQAIQQEIEDLNRRILLAVLLFVLFGAALGYWMAERIADPVNRLQRATARIARGDLTARVALTASDELRRLVEAFNQMASELQRQQGELARIYKLEAWADMARQVAHDIKNPLTPIQLSAEHLRRVHADRGAPLSPVLDGCVDSILTQVRLLRQIAGEFSSFASSPTARAVETSVADLVAEVVDAYRPGLAGRVDLLVNLAAGLPLIRVDRTLIGRALTNVIDNSLHAMPNGGTVRVAATHEGAVVRLTVTDTGVGMDAAAVAHLFEPYFSTKATGTGLGLTIAKRNVELNGGTITVESTPGTGTTVTMAVPVAAPSA